MVGVSLNDGRPAHAFMKVVETVDGDTIENTASERIESGSGVKTDGLPAYNAGLTAWIPSRASHHQGPEDRLKEAPLGAHTRRQREEHDKGLSGTVDWILRHARRLTLSYPSRPRGLPVVVRQLSRMWIYHSSCLHLSQTQGLREGTGLALV
jgi:hypothetical protein